MRFSSWLKEQASRTDSVGTFAKWANGKKFPVSSDPSYLKIFVLGNQPQQYENFVAAFLEYAKIQGNQVPKSYKGLAEIVSILQ